MVSHVTAFKPYNHRDAHLKRHDAAGYETYNTRGVQEPLKFSTSAASQLYDLHGIFVMSSALPWLM
jgi:hypothetical protein